MNTSKQKIIVVCHDAGGAEIISAYVKAKQADFNFLCYTAGPAVDIFKKKKIPAVKLPSGVDAEKILEGHLDAGLVVAGAGWSSPIEFQFIRGAKKLGIRSAVYLDHWGNYRERFGYPRSIWRQNIPAEIWVGDRAALTLAKKHFFGLTRFRLVPNEYFLEIKKAYKKISVSKKGHGRGILILTEPMSAAINSFGDHPKKPGYTEFEWLENILRQLSAARFSSVITVRTHPAESPTKYDAILKRYSEEFKITKSTNSDLLVDLVAVKAVVGYASMALVIARLCGKKTFGVTVGDRKKARVLPFSGINNISSQAALRKLLISVRFMGYL